MVGCNNDNPVSTASKQHRKQSNNNDQCLLSKILRLKIR